MSVHFHEKNLKLLTAPIIKAVSLTKAKEHLRVSNNTEDAFIQSLISAATSHVESVTGRLLISQTWDLFMDRFPSRRNRRSEWWDGVREIPLSELESLVDFILIDKAPIQSVTFLKTFDTQDNELTFSSANYLVDTIREPGRITLREGQVWPQTNLRTANGIQIQFIAGYISEALIPDPITQALLLLIGHLYENRGDENVDFPKAFAMLLQPFMLTYRSLI